MNEKKSGVRPFWVEALHTIALFALAVAQPVFSTIGEAPEFLVAHSATPLVIVAFAVGLALIAPLAIIAVEWLVSRISRPAGRLLHGLVVLVLLGIIAQQVLDRFLDLDVRLLLGLSLLLAVFASLFYWRSATVSRMVSIAAIGALLLPLNFLFVSPASKLVLNTEDDDLGEVSRPKQTPPIVFIVFDEFNPTALLDENKQIDEVRYPHFAALVKDSWWFPRATSPIHVTSAAIPALLTGKQPDPAKALPNFVDHPHNLFTLLEPSYTLNVWETLTSLCPTELCHSVRQVFEPRRFVTDLAIVTAHIVLPEDIASEALPPLKNNWFGFARDEEDIFKSKLQANANRSRLRTIDEFIASAGGESARLDFLHVLLPHSPYEFLPSGKSYNPSRSPIGLADDLWVDDQQLINLDYQRYMLQLGLVEQKVGELVAHLKHKGVYDKTLIIITADHGRVFSPLRPVRAMSKDNAELLHVPLIVKLPQQTEGRVADLTASTLDIIPTIAAELGVELPWESDGVPLFSESFPRRERLSLKWFGEAFEFTWDEIVRLPLLNWQHETFASRQPLTHLTIKRDYSELIGQRIADFNLSGEEGTPKAALKQNLSATASYSSQNALVPLMIDTEIIGDVPKNAWVLIAVNEVVAAVAPVYSDKTRPYVSALLPERMFKNGFNAIEAYFVVRNGGDIQLSRIATETDGFRLLSEENMLASDAGKTFPIRDARLGYVDRLMIDSGALRMSGWSADRSTRMPAEVVAIFDGGHYVCAARPDIERRDVAKHLGAEEALLSGFSVVCPYAAAEVDRRKLQAIAVFSDGTAGYLTIK